MNLKLFISLLLTLSMVTVFGQVQKSKDSQNRVKPKKTSAAVTTAKPDNQNRPLPVKPAVSVSEWMIPVSELKFMELPYAYNALEPVIDAKTVELHYDKHHRNYYNNFMNAIKGTELEKMPITKIFANIKSQPDAVRNNAGGYYNHVLYWQNLSPDGGGEPSGELAMAINKTFGDFKTFTDKLSEAGKTRFGSGWAWLAVDINTGDLFITSTANQDNPLMENAERLGIPILALDVWEHAYYLNYQNRRADYIAAFWKKVNWPDVEAKYKGFQQMRDELKK